MRYALRNLSTLLLRIYLCSVKRIIYEDFNFQSIENIHQWIKKFLVWDIFFIVCKKKNKPLQTRC